MLFLLRDRGWANLRRREHRTRYCGRDVATPAGTHFKDCHAYGFLWIPATATSPGSARFFFDRVNVGPTTTWTQWMNQPVPTAVAPSTPQPSWAMSGADVSHYFVILGTGPNEPMTVSRVNVWQTSDAGISVH